MGKQIKRIFLRGVVANDLLFYGLLLVQNCELMLRNSFQYDVHLRLINHMFGHSCRTSTNY